MLWSAVASEARHRFGLFLVFRASITKFLLGSRNICCPSGVCASNTSARNWTLKGSKVSKRRLPHKTDMSKSRIPFGLTLQCIDCRQEVHSLLLPVLI